MPHNPFVHGLITTMTEPEPGSASASTACRVEKLREEKERERGGIEGDQSGVIRQDNNLLSYDGCFTSCSLVPSIPSMIILIAYTL